MCTFRKVTGSPAHDRPPDPSETFRKLLETSTKIIKASTNFQNLLKTFQCDGRQWKASHCPSPLNPWRNSDRHLQGTIIWNVSCISSRRGPPVDKPKRAPAAWPSSSISTLQQVRQVVFAASLAMPGDRIILIKIYNGTSERTNLKENDMIMYNYVMVDDLWFAVKKLTWITSHVPLSKRKVVLAPTWGQHHNGVHHDQCARHQNPRIVCLCRRCSSAHRQLLQQTSIDLDLEPLMRDDISNPI